MDMISLSLVWLELEQQMGVLYFQLYFIIAKLSYMCMCMCIWCCRDLNVYFHVVDIRMCISYCIDLNVYFMM